MTSGSSLFFNFIVLLATDPRFSAKKHLATRNGRLTHLPGRGGSTSTLGGRSGGHGSPKGGLLPETFCQSISTNMQFLT